jgi:hypothetical protein
MPITLTIAGTKTKVDTSAVEAAFVAAIAEVPADRGIWVSLASPALSKIAQSHGLGRVIGAGVGGQYQKTVYPGALIDRVSELLGGAQIAGNYRSEPEPEPVSPPGVKVTLRQASHVGSYAKPWVASIRGAHSAYRFDRGFVEASTTERGGSWVYHLEDGLYELCDRNSKGDERRWFVRVAGAEIVAVERAEVEAAFPELPGSEAVEIPESGTVECLECGAVYPGSKAHLVDSHGMGCVRCNH